MCLNLPARSATAAIAISAAIATTTTAATRTATTAATGITALGSWTSFVYRNRPSTQIGAVQCCDRSVCLCAVSHFHKAEAAQTTAKLIPDQIYFANRSILSKSLSQIVFACTKGEVSHVDIQMRDRPFGDVTYRALITNQTQAGATLEEGFLSAATA